MYKEITSKYLSQKKKKLQVNILYNNKYNRLNEEDVNRGC